MQWKSVAPVSFLPKLLLTLRSHDVHSSNMGGRRLHQRNSRGHLHVRPGVVPGALRLLPQPGVRRHLLRQQDAQTGLHHHAGSPPGLVRREDGRPALPPRPLRRGLLGGGHPGRPGSHPQRHHRHGPPHQRHLQRLRGRVLHPLRRAVRRGLHRRHPAVLHLHRPVDVHTVRLDQRARGFPLLDGRGLDRRGEERGDLVLHGLRAVVGVRRHPVAGVLPEGVVQQVGG